MDDRRRRNQPAGLKSTKAVGIRHFGCGENLNRRIQSVGIVINHISYQFLLGADCAESLVLGWLCSAVSVVRSSVTAYTRVVLRQCRIVETWLYAARGGDCPSL